VVYEEGDTLGVVWRGYPRCGMEGYPRWCICT